MMSRDTLVHARMRKEKLVLFTAPSDQGDILQDFLDWHLELGVDLILAMDHGSTDGSTDILERYSKTHPVVWYPVPERDITKYSPADELATLARDKYGADWIIHCDADEFLCTGGRDLRTLLAQADRDNLTLINVPRRTVTGSRLEPGQRATTELTLRIDQTVYLTLDQILSWNLPVPFVFVEVGGHLIVRASAFDRYGGGAHGATTTYGQSGSIDGLYILHYAIRDFESLRVKVDNTKSWLAANTHLEPTQCWHWRRWIHLNEQGLLRADYDQQFPSPDRAQELIATGACAVDRTVADWAERRAAQRTVSIPVMRPRLPEAPELLPYLSRIDSSRVYSNFGPLTREFETRLAGHFGVNGNMLTTVANATIGLTLALLAQHVKAGTLCVVPAWTFVASAQAAVAAGLVPHFVDVDRDTWALEPEMMDGIIASAPGEVGAVMPVMPFGRRLNFGGWDAFQARTGVPVVIDAAAGFDALTATNTPAVMSLHATKAFGIGEGAFVLATDRAIVKAVRTRANFGFDGQRDATVHAINGKLSEYHAAVGHAALDEWPRARSEWFTVAGLYRDHLECRRARLQDGFGQSWISSVCVIELADQDVASVEARLRRAGIETRYWWSDGAHAHQSTRHFSRTAVPVTEYLARSTIAVPFYRDMRAEDVERVVTCLFAEDNR